MGWESHLYGDSGADKFLVGGNTIVEDAELGQGDTVENVGIRLYGGVSQWWMEAGYAAWAGITPFLSASPFGGALMVTGAILTDTPMMKFARYKVDAQGALQVTLGWGQAGAAAVKNYTMDLATGIGTGGIAVFRTGASAVAGQVTSVGTYERWVNNVLKAARGLGLNEVDPLVLDLDGNGFELKALNNSSVHFDYARDGYAKKTGWVFGGDGFLVRDMNANGKIDDLTEMFGNATTGGFQMLATFDANGDGAITAADTVYSQLKVWVDANSDAVTDAGELKTLADLGIVSISLAHVAPASPLRVEGNNVARTSTFTLANGQTRAIGDVAFGVSPVDTKYLGDTTVSAAAAALPELKGFGRVKDLRVAMTQDAGLRAQVATFSALSTTNLSALKSSAEAILYAWAGVASTPATAIGANGFDTRKLAFLETFGGIEILPRDGNGNLVIDALGAVEAQWKDHLSRLTLRLVVQGPMATQFAEVNYNTDWDLLISQSPTALSDILRRVLVSLPTSSHAAAASAWAEWAPLLNGLTESMVRSDANVVRVDYLFAQLLRALDGVMTPLSVSDVATAMGIQNLQIGTTANDIQTRAAEGTALYLSGGGTDTITGGRGQDVFVFGRTVGNVTIGDSEAFESGDRIRFAFLNPSDVKMVRAGDDLLITVIATNETVRVLGQFAPVLAITSEVLASPNRGVEDIQFADGSIMEIPEIMAAVGTGTDGNDIMIGTMHSDVLIGGKGNDRLEGGDDADLYVVRAGDGQDVIIDQQTTPLLRAVDMLVFGDGLAPEDLTFSRDGDQLVISTGGANNVRIENQFAYGVLGYNAKFALNTRVEAFAFKEYADSWSSKEVQQLLIEQGTTGGNDTTLGFGDDDVFDMSAGNDVLIGLDGQDTYRWGKGAGNDTIDERALYIDINVGMSGLNLGLSADTIEFDESVSLEGLVFSRSTSAPDLKITITETGETLTVKDQFGGIQTGPLGAQWFNRIEWFKLANGTVLSWQDVLLKVTTGGAGNDSLYGDLWQDTLSGGLGNDYLSGGGYGDTYRFNLGGGQDTIEDANPFLLGGGYVQADNDPDTLVLGPGIAPGDISFEHVGTDIKLLIGSGGDSVTLKGQDKYIHTGVFGAVSWDRIEAIRFDNGTIWTWAQLQQRVIESQTTAGNDSVRGFTLEDAFAASAGNDVLMGGDSSDTYVFGIGSGHDEVRDEVSNVLYSDDDMIEFAAGITTANIRLVRDGADLLVSIAGNTNDDLRVVGQFENYVRFTFKQVEKFKFADGTIWTATDVQNRLLLPTSGNDTLVGYYTDDTLAGGLGNDTLRGGDGSDTYVFNRGDGQDRVEESVQFVQIGDDDTLRFGATIAPADIIISRSGNDLVLGLQGSTDTVTIAGQWEQYVWFSNNDIERFEFADGTVWTKDEVAARMLAGTPGNDTLVGTFGNDRLDGGAGNDVLEGGDGSDTYVFGRGYGQDRIRESVSFVSIGDDDRLLFKAGIAPSDLIYTRDDQDLIISIAGTTDSIRIEGEFSYDAWFTWRDVERFEFADGTIITKETIRQQLLAGTNGNDTITGFASDDILDGGAGNDVLQGSDGSDTYRFGVGDGQDLIREGLYDGRLSEDDTLEMKAGVLPGDVTVTRINEDAIFTLVSGDAVRVEGQFIEGYNEFLSSNDVERVRFADGTVWDKAEIVRRSLRPTEGDDYLIGSRYAETIGGLGGNDTVLAGGNNDVVTGGAGDDSLFGGEGDDDLSGGTGNDLLSGGGGDDIYRYARGDGRDVVRDYSDPFGGWGGNDAIVFAAGIAPSDVTVTQGQSGNDLILSISGGTDTITIDDPLSNPDDRIEEVRFADGTIWTHAQLVEKASGATSGDDTIYGTYDTEVLSAGAGNDTVIARQGDDILIGGTGNDVLQGNGGNDTYRFARGDGQDIIRDYFDFGSGYGGTDTVEFAAGIAPTDIVVTQSAWGSGLTLSIIGSADSVTLDQSLYNGDQRIEQVRFADGTIWTHAQLVEKSMLVNGGNDTFYGSYDTETLTGGAGNDTIIARQGDDVLIGGTGNDLLQGNGGNDTYRFSRGDGQDIVQDYFDFGSGWGGVDTIEFTAGIAPTDIIVTQSAWGSGLTLTISGTTDSVTLDQSLYNGDQRIEQVRFADGTIWTHAQLVEKSMLANSGNDTFYGTYDTETLTGGAGNDTIIARQGDDVLIGGTGNDLLQGNGGNDTYRFSRGDGQDIVRDYFDFGSGWGGVDTIEFTAGIAPTDIIVAQSGNGSSLVLSISGTADAVTLDGTLWNGDQRIEQVRFSDGTVWAHAELVQRSLLANSGNDTFFGSYDAETLNGGAGNDTINAGAGDDIVIGGAGNDLLQGNGGGDTYRFARGDGQDIIRDYNDSYGGWGGGPDTIEFATGITPTDIVVSLGDEGRDIILSIDGTSDKITIDNGMWSGDWRLENVRFSDGTTWDFDALVTRIVPYTDGPDVLVGTSANDVMRGAGGNDQLSGLGGADQLSGDEGADVLDGGAGDDILTGGEGDDTLIGGDGNDVFRYTGVANGFDAVDGGLNADSIVTMANGTVIGLTALTAVETISANGFTNVSILGSGNADSINLASVTVTGITKIDGGAGNDSISGPATAFTIVGGAGDDTLTGGAGSDVFVFSGVNEGFDAITGGGGTDTIQAGSADTTIGLRSLSTVEAVTANGFSNVQISGSGVADSLDFSAVMLAGIASISGGAGADVIVGSTAADTIRGGLDNDTLTGGAGDDSLFGDEGNDSFQYSGTTTGFDSVDGGIGTDAISALANGTTIGLTSVANVETITAGAFTGVTIAGSANADTLSFAGVTLTGITKIDAGAGNDIVTGSSGADTIVGGGGDDTLAGGDGNDTFQYTGTANGFDAINGGLGTDTLSALANGTIIGLSSVTGVEVVTAGAFTGVSIAGSTNADTLNFTGVTLTGITKIDGGSGNDVITGSAAADILVGGDGDDVLAGGDGNDAFQYSGSTNGFDVVDGGLGTDTISALANGTVIGLASVNGVETISAGTFTGVSILGSASADVLNFSTATLTAITTIDGGSGNDTITGSAAVDTILGSGGDDVLAGGGGNDVFQYTGTNSGFDAVDGGAGTDTISALANSTVIGLSSITAIETISAGTFTGVTIAGSGNADTLNFTGVTITGISRIDGGAGNDTITGPATAITIAGGLGDDTLTGGAGADVFVFSGNADGFDAITGGAGTDTIQAGSADTIIGLRSLSTVEAVTANGFSNVQIGGSGVADSLDFAAVTLTGIASINGGAGADVIVGSIAADTIRGGLDNDTLTGGAGDDALFGDDGNDSFQYSGTTSGFDSVDGGIGTDTISALANATVIGLTSVANVETITAGTFTGVSIAGSANADNLNFGATTLTAITKIDGGAGNDIITGSAAADTILGSGGDDVLVGGLGNDVFQYTGTANGFDSVDGGAGTDTISALANSTVIGLSALSNVETISAGSFTGVTIAGSANADTLNFSATTLTAITKIDGGLGNDTITGSAAVDTILGSGGDDILAGGGGNDIFQYTGTANGFDAVDGGAGTDTISALANSTVIGLSSVIGVETISAGSFTGVTIAGSANADTLDFSAVTLTAITAINAGLGSDIVTGGAAADTINGGDGNDTLTGGAGNDVLNGDNNDDRLIAGAGNDTINGGAGIDTVDYSAYTANVTVSLAVTTAQTVTTSDADTISNVENLTGGSGADTLTGSTLVNVLNGGSGNDRLTGGAGNDTIIGGVGTIDIAVFAGLQASYTIATNLGVVTVKDNQATTDGDDGTDTISGIEKVEFKGGVQQSVTSPIVLNLDGNGVSLLHNTQTNVTFDWNQDGLADQTGWIGAGDAFLFCDRDGNGTVSGANELSFADDKFAAKSDLDGLTSFDTNGDNVLAGDDTDFAKFMVWQDSNGNGRAENGEVRSLRDAGIASISLAGTAVNRTWAWGDNMTVNTGVFSKVDGSVGSFSDVALSYDSATQRRMPSRPVFDAYSFGRGRPWFERSLSSGDPRFETEVVDADLIDNPDEPEGIDVANASHWDADFSAEKSAQYAVEAMPEEFAVLPTLADSWRNRYADVPTEQIWTDDLPVYAEAANQAGQLAQAMATFGAVGAFEFSTFDQSDRFDVGRISMIDRGRREGAFGERCDIA